MMKILSFLCLISHLWLFAQEKPIPTTELNELLIVGKNGKVQIDAEKPAVFPLGTTALRNMIGENFSIKKVITSAEKNHVKLFLSLIKTVL